MSGVRWVLAVVLMCGFNQTLQAQKTAIYTDKDAEFKQGLDLFEKQQYASAQHCFIETTLGLTDRNTLVCSEADYYSALCSMELFHRDAEYLLKKFLKDHPESPRVKSVYLNLGRYNYRKKNYHDAIEWFNHVDSYDLNASERSEYYFKRGYSYLQNNSDEKAKTDFAEVKDEPGVYAVPALYYHAHVLYTEKSYESALQEFQKLIKDPTFGAVVPYYIAQIFYLQHKYEEVIQYAPDLLDSASTKRAPELARILGESYFKTNRYKEAIPYLERYHKSALLNRPDSYELGYAYFMSDNFDAALLSFKDAIGPDDSLSQNASYHLGCCYLKKNNKQLAQNAFSEASRMHFSREIREDALFSFAELTYELSYSPFNEAIKALQQYIAEYPGSPKADQAYAFLVKINLVTKNYEEALKSIESIKLLKEELKPVYQQIAYNRGVELYNNFEYDPAIALFRKAMKYPVDPVTNALGKYWTAEASYQKAERKPDPQLYETALDNYRLYMVAPGAPRTPMYNTVDYEIGYALFQLKQYPEAVIAFRKYVLQKEEPAEKRCNAYMRIGDGYYVTKDFLNAADYYDLAFSTKTDKGSEKDYALYHKGMAQGLEKKYEKKIATLVALLKLYPQSPYTVASKYEVAHTCQLIDKLDEAIPYYQSLITENNGSPYVRKSYDQLGLIYYNKNDYDNALQSYEKVVSMNINSEEAINDIPQIQHIYEDIKKDPEGYATWLKQHGRDVAASHLDSATYQIANRYYTDGDCGKAVEALGKYISKYPSGIFCTESNFMNAECKLKNKDLDGALGGYSYVLNQPSGKYTEPSLRRAAAICFNKGDFKTAYDDYSKLEAWPQDANDARIGMMRAAWALKDYDNAPIAANKILTSDNVSADLATEAHLVLARSAMQKQNTDLAYNEYALAKAGSKNENGAEAAYNIALIQNIRKDYKLSEKSVFEIMKEQAGYKVWVGKSFLLLSDNYIALNDTFQAKYVLNNFIAHTDLADLKLQAQDKLNKIQEAEKAKALAKPEKDITIPMDTPEDQKLFEDDKKETPQ